MNSSKHIVSSRRKKTWRRLHLRFRKATWWNRHLPDFIIIGAQKSGTSSLYHYLGQHPKLIRSYKKEIHFFDGGLDPEVDNFKKGPSWYRSHFPLKWHIGNDLKTFESSPLYLFNPLVPQRISELIPDVKLIIILRNPVERAISHYFHVQKKNRDPLPIFEALQAEEKRLKPILNKQDYKNNIYIRHSYKSRGLYYEQIMRYLDYFQMKNLLVINSEMLFMQPDKVLRSVFEFVGVNSEFTVKDLKPRNVGSNRAGVDPGVYVYLKNYYKPHNKKLYELIRNNFGW